MMASPRAEHERPPAEDARCARALRHVTEEGQVPPREHRSGRRARTAAHPITSPRFDAEVGRLEHVGGRAADLAARAAVALPAAALQATEHAAPLVVAALFWSRERPLLSGAARSLVAAYLVLLCGMWWRALCSLRRGAAVRVAGATLFFATDLFAIAMKVEQTGAYVPWIWALYPPALIGLAWSFWAEA